MALELESLRKAIAALVRSLRVADEQAGGVAQHPRLRLRKKTIELDGSPESILDQFNQHSETTKFNAEKALSKDWTFNTELLPCLSGSDFISL